MIVYHGSCEPVIHPDICHSRKAVDFGPGFYVTPIYEQARQWAEKFRFRNMDSYVSHYLLDEKCFSDSKVLKFDTYSDEWLMFVMNCRQEKDIGDYDIILGGVADDKVFNTLELYFDGLIDKTEALRRLKYEKPNLQICLRTQKILDGYLRFEGYEAL